MKRSKGVKRRVHSVSPEEYDVVRSRYFEGFRAKSWYLPNEKNFEKCMMSVFFRSGKRLVGFVEVFRDGKRNMRCYKFNSTYVVVEIDESNGIIEMKARNIGKHLRFSLVASCMSLWKPLERVIDMHVVTDAALCTVSNLFRLWVLDGRPGQFGVWIEKQPQMKKLIIYRQTHTTRDALWSVGEANINVI